MVTLRCLQTLKEGAWINDEVVNCFLKLITQREENIRRIDPQRPLRGNTTTHFYTLLTNADDPIPERRGFNYNKIAAWGRRKSPTGDIFQE
jgi:Ulp1 family protease